MTPPWPSELEDDPAVIYALDEKLCLAYCNKAWDRFALENGGAPEILRASQIGRPIMRAVPALLQPFYQALYARAMGGGRGGDHFYECSSPDRSRWFHMHVTRMELVNHAPFLVAIHSMIVEGPMSRTAHAYTPEKYKNEFGLITMCAHCRRTLVPDSKNVWVWVPELLQRMTGDVSHGLCQVCFGVHYRIREE